MGMSLGVIITNDEEGRGLGILSEYGSVLIQPNGEYIMHDRSATHLDPLAVICSKPLIDKAVIQKVIEELDESGIDYRLMLSSETKYLKDSRPELFKVNN